MNGCAIEISSYVPSGPRQEAGSPADVVLVTNLTNYANHCQPNGQSKLDRGAASRPARTPEVLRCRCLYCLFAGSAVGLASVSRAFQVLALQALAYRMVCRFGGGSGALQKGEST